MKTIFKYLKKYWILALLAPIFMILEVIFDLVQPQLLERMVDNGILNETIGASQKVELVLIIGGLMLGALTVGGFCGIMSGVCASAASNNMGNDLRVDVFSRVVDLSFEQTDKFTTGSLVTRITNDITVMQDSSQMLIRMFIRTLVLFIGGFIFMAITSKAFALILLCALPIQIILIFIFLYVATPYFSIMQERVDTVNSVVQENVNGIRVVKAFTQEENEKKRFGMANDALCDVYYKVNRFFALMSPFIMIILNGVTIAIIYYSGVQIHNNEVAIYNDIINTGSTELMSVGKVVSGLNYVTMVLMSVISLTMLFQFITRARISARRVNEVLDSMPVVNSGSGEINTNETGTIEFKDVSFSYPNYSSKPVISNFSLKINKGERIAILGATGSGKTSLVNLVPRFYDVTSGSVCVDGVDVKEYKLEDLRDKVCTVLQRTELFSGTIKENVRWGKVDATDEEIVNACTIAQADEFIRANPEGYDKYIDRGGVNVSGGQKQRIAIARALVKKPEILIFDDSTSALDLKTEANLHKALKDNLSDTTVVIIAQRVASAKNCDRIAIIDEGKLVACDSHDVLINTCQIYQDIYNSQLNRGDSYE